MEDAACALVRCSAGLRDDDPSKAAKLQSEQRGQAYVTEQKLLVSEGAFTYSVADAKLDQLNRVDVRNRGGLTVEEESNRQLALKACATDTRCASGVNDYYTNLKSERAERTLSVVNAIKVLESCSTDKSCIRASLEQMEALRANLRQAREPLYNTDVIALSANIARARSSLGEVRGALDMFAAAMLGAKANEVGNNPGKGAAASSIPPKLPTNDAQISHIFNERPGHLPDTPTNRALIQDLSSNQSNLLGTDRFGNQWFQVSMPDGSQVWSSVRNGVIQNGGINNPPKVFNPATGLSNPSKPPQPTKK